MLEHLLKAATRVGTPCDNSDSCWNCLLFPFVTPIAGPNYPELPIFDYGRYGVYLACIEGHPGEEESVRFYKRMLNGVCLCG